MSSEHEEVELGKNVSNLFRSKTRRETSVISVRLTGDEIKRLESIGRYSDKTVSQVIRDAISAYRVQGPETVVGLWNGLTVAVGDTQEASGNAQCEVHYPAPEPGTPETT